MQASFDDPSHFLLDKMPIFSLNGNTEIRRIKAKGVATC